MAETQVKVKGKKPVWAGVLSQAPRTAGVYLFKDAGGRVLYVGKAINLKNRLSSYLKTPEKHDPKTALMLSKAARVDFVLTTQAREALILERTLIKEHAPRYNVRLRDDKNFLCLRLDLKETFPALRLVRRFAGDGALYFGPYTSSAAVRETIKVMKQVFGLRTCKERRLAPRTRPCLEGQMDRCLAPCAGGMTEEAYRRVVHQAVQFLRGRNRHLLRSLKEEMEQAAANLDFEKAAVLRDRIQAIQATLERQAMARPTSRDQDVVGVTQEGEEALVLVFLVRAGLVTGSQEYYFQEIPAGGDLLGDFLKQYYAEGRPLPDEILVPWDIADRKVLAEVLSEQRGKPVRLVVDKGAGDQEQLLPNGGAGSASLRKSQSERSRLLALAQENARMALKRRQSLPQAADPLADLQERLSLPRIPNRLECLDISTMQGGQPVGSLVAFAGSQPDKAGYRRFRIRGVAGQDDYAMLQEVVRRHYGKEGRILPDLLVVDGGKGQLAAVLEALQDLGLADLPVVGLAKSAPQADGREVPDRLFLPGRKNPKILPASSPGWLLLLRLRDEAHRFAVTYHRRRARQELVSSALAQVPGLGPRRQQLLLQHFAGLEDLKQAELEDLRVRGRLPLKVAQDLKNWLENQEPTGRGSQPG